MHATKGERFANFVIDNIVLFVIHFGLSFVLGVLAVLANRLDLLDLLDGPLDIAIGLGIEVVFYIAFEALTGVTLGKLATGTVVVNEQGQPATTGQIVGRSFARLIPFEPFSFFGSKPGGWHDTLSKTHVVKKNSLVRPY